MSKKSRAEIQAVTERIRVLTLEGKRVKEIAFDVCRSDSRVSQFIKRIGFTAMFVTPEERAHIFAGRAKNGIQCVPEQGDRA